jgi:hypothetical protein
LLRSDFDGIQPTLRQVPPRAPRFSMQATYNGENGLLAREAQFGIGSYTGGRYVSMKHHCSILVYRGRDRDRDHRRKGGDNMTTHLQTLLSCLNRRNITGDTAADDDKIFLLYGPMVPVS